MQKQRSGLGGDFGTPGGWRCAVQWVCAVVRACTGGVRKLDQRGARALRLRLAAGWAGRAGGLTGLAGGSMDGQPRLARWSSVRSRFQGQAPGARLCDCAVRWCLLQCNRPSSHSPESRAMSQGPGVFASTRTPLSPGPQPLLPSTFSCRSCCIHIWLR